MDVSVPSYKVTQNCDERSDVSRTLVQRKLVEKIV
jgi:hypothetical protein